MKEVPAKVVSRLRNLVSGIPAEIGQYTGSDSPVVNRDESLVNRMSFRLSASWLELGPRFLDENEMVTGFIRYLER